MKALAIAAVLCATGCATVPDHPADAARVLAQMRASCGGSAWERVQGWHEMGVAEVSVGRFIENEVWHDMQSLKTRMIGRVNGKVVRDFGFDGERYWQVRQDGQVEVGSDVAVVRRHRRDAYLSSFGWFFPQRFPAEVQLAPAQTLDGKAFQVLRITPKDADSFDLWVDPETHVVRRIVAGEEYANLSDYRTFDGVCTATKGQQGDADPKHQITLHVQSVDTTKPIPATMFQPPIG